MKRDDFLDLESKLGIDETARVALYLNLIQYTKGDAYATTIHGGESGVYVTYRYIYAKGRDDTVECTMLKRTNEQPGAGEDDCRY